MNKHIFLEPTLLGAKLNLTHEQEHMCKVVYKKDPEGDGHFFDSLWDASGETLYNDDYIIVPLRSTFSRKFDIVAGWTFANIIGSSFDPRPCHAWIDLLRSNQCIANRCITDGRFYLTATNLHDDQHFCNTSFVGGHVIDGVRPLSANKGGEVKLVSICQKHNVTGNGVVNPHYMVSQVNGKGAILANYLKLDKANKE